MTLRMIYRGDIVKVVAPGAYGKPRPAVVIQADVLTGVEVNSVLVCLVSSHVVDATKFRLLVEPNTKNGLLRASQIMVEKIISMPRNRIVGVVGKLDDEAMIRLNRALAFVLGLGQ